MSTTPSPSRQPARTVPIGRVLKAHGLSGALLVDAFGETLASLESGETVMVVLGRAVGGAATASTARRFTIRAARALHGISVLVELAEIESREDAAGLRGAELQVERSRLPPLDPGEFYRGDLLNLEVVKPGGEPLGRVHAFLDLKAHDVLVVRDANRETLLPMVDDVIREIDVAAGRIVATPHELEDTRSPAPRLADRRRSRSRGRSSVGRAAPGA